MILLGQSVRRWHAATIGKRKTTKKNEESCTSIESDWQAHFQLNPNTLDKRVAHYFVGYVGEFNAFEVVLEHIIWHTVQRIS